MKAGASAFVIYTAGGVALAAQSTGWGWLLPFIPLLGLLPLETDMLCETDPPGFEPMTAAEIYAAIVTIVPSASQIAAKVKLANNLQTLAWYAFCECVTGPQPTQPAAPAPPADLPQIVAPPLVSAVPCKTQSYSDQTYGPNNGLNRSGMTTADNAYSWFKCFMSTTQVVAPGPNITFKWRAESGNQANPILREDQYILAPNTSQTVVLPYTPSAQGFTVTQLANGTAGSTLAHAFVEAYCNGQNPLSPVQPCCPPDPTTVALLDQILQHVTLIQRQSVPFGYVPGVVHPLLSGTGEFDIADIIGLKVSATTLPGQLGEASGTPVEVFDAGFVTTGTVDGWHRSYRLDHFPRLIMPLLGSDTRVGYSLHPGVVVSVQELLREP